jgi:hypothetical protein
MAEPVLRPTDIDPREFIDEVDHPVRSADAEVLLDLMEDAGHQGNAGVVSVSTQKPRS